MYASQNISVNHLLGNILGNIFNSILFALIIFFLPNNIICMRNLSTEKIGAEHLMSGP